MVSYPWSGPRCGWPSSPMPKVAWVRVRVRVRVRARVRVRVRVRVGVGPTLTLALALSQVAFWSMIAYWLRKYETEKDHTWRVRVRVRVRGRVRKQRVTTPCARSR